MVRIWVRSPAEDLSGRPWNHKYPQNDPLTSYVFRAMQAAGFIFLERKWERDRPHIDSLLHYFNSPEMDEPLILLLFPEGTDLTPNTKSKSDQFAEQKNLKKYDFVLHPR